MMREDKVRGWLYILFSFLTLFVVICFIVTCSVMLFVSLLSSELGVILGEEDVALAAKVTFVNVIVISLILTVTDFVRRRLTIDKPVEDIRLAAERIAEGDRGVRIEKVNNVLGGFEFNEIIDSFNAMARELEGVESLRTDFISNVSHEMKTPISVIKNYAALLNSESLSEEDRLEYSRGINSAATRLSDMITNILKLSKLENQEVYPTSEAFSLSDELCSSIIEYEQVIENKQIEIITDIEDDVTVNADKELLSIVWSNLLSNALKFTGEHGRVKISLSTSKEDIIVTVSDTGCGMTPEVGARIFEKFYQADGSRATEGNGLGLALVKRIIDIMKGEISVVSEVGVGTTFTVKLFGINER